MELEIGKAYFEISWASTNTQVPDIETYIYIGKDIFNRNPTEHFFQTSHSFQAHGNFAELKDRKQKQEAEIILMKSDTIETLSTIEELIDQLNSLGKEYGNQFGSMKRKHSECSS